MHNPIRIWRLAIEFNARQAKNLRFPAIFIRLDDSKGVEAIFVSASVRADCPSCKTTLPH